MAKRNPTYALLSFLLITNAASEVHWNLPSSPGNAPFVCPGFIGFGIEMKSFPDYAGVDEPNDFSNYMLHQLYKRTNAPVHLRVGGTSMDNTHYNSAQNTVYQPTGPQDCRLHREGTIGRPWLENSFGNLNSSLTRYTLEIPLARKNVNNGIKFTKACLNAMPSKTSQLDAIEIGNEPNLYTSSPKPSCAPETDRPDGWKFMDYAKELREYTKNLYQDIGVLKNSGRKDWIQGLTISSGYKTDEWDLNANRWNALTRGGYLKTISQHYYQVNSDGTKTDYPPDHVNTVSILETKFRHNINFLKNQTPAVPFILGEVGTVMSDSNNDSNQKLFNRLGSAIWTFDFLLYGMSMGIERVSMQMASNFPMSAWHPVGKKSIHANYYGMVAAADFIGQKGNLQIKHLPTDGHPHFGAYAGFNNGKLTKVAVVNTNFWERTDAQPQRPERQVKLSGLGNDVTKVRVLRLSAPKGATDTHIHWAGRRWTAEDDGKEYQDGQKPVMINVSDGTLDRDVIVGPSEAVLVELVRG